MPYVLSPVINEDFKGLWNEGNPFTKEKIYDINSNKLNSPPVNYSSYTFKPHSLTHLETGAHTQNLGKTVDWYFQEKNYSPFWGKVVVIKLEGLGFVEHERIAGLRIWEISETELKNAINAVTQKATPPARILIAPFNVPVNEHGLHKPNHVFVLAQKAADYLISNPEFQLFGTSWKSTDFQPYSRTRPIHNTIFSQAVILENLKINDVPAGEYFLNAFPIPVAGASESPVCPVLFTKEELAAL